MNEWLTWIEDRVNDLLIALDRIAVAAERIAATSEQIAEEGQREE